MSLLSVSHLNYGLQTPIFRALPDFLFPPQPHPHCVTVPIQTQQYLGLGVGVAPGSLLFIPHQVATEGPVLPVFHDLLAMKAQCCPTSHQAQGASFYPFASTT